MNRLYLVRHGRAAAGWDTDPDPGLDEIGKQQAIDVGARLAPLGPLHVEVSPLRRCQETAAPLLAAWRLPLMIEPRIAEIPSPEGVAMADRVDWLRAAMRGTWSVSIYTDPKQPAVANQSFLVEDFVPDRIEFDMTADKTEIAAREITATSLASSA